MIEPPGGVGAGAAWAEEPEAMMGTHNAAVVTQTRCLLMPGSWHGRRWDNRRPGARSSMDRATGFYPVGWGFESLRARASAITRTIATATKGGMSTPKTRITDH